MGACVVGLNLVHASRGAEDTVHFCYFWSGGDAEDGPRGWYIATAVATEEGVKAFAVGSPDAQPPADGSWSFRAALGGELLAGAGGFAACRSGASNVESGAGDTSSAAPATGACATTSQTAAAPALVDASSAPGGDAEASSELAQQEAVAKVEFTRANANVGTAPEERLTAMDAAAEEIERGLVQKRAELLAIDAKMAAPHKPGESESLQYLRLRAEAVVAAAQRVYEGSVPTDGGKTPAEWRAYWFDAAAPLEDALARANAEVSACAQKRDAAAAQLEALTTPGVLRALELISARAAGELGEAERRRDAAVAELERPSGRYSVMTLAQRVAQARSEEAAACARFERSTGWAQAVVRRVNAMDAERRALEADVGTLEEGRALLRDGKKELVEQMQEVKSARERLLAVKRQIAAEKRAAKVARTA